MTDFRFTRVAVVGARSQIGRYLLPRLKTAGCLVFSIGREASHSDGDQVYAFDEKEAAFTPSLGVVDAIVSLAPLPSIEVVMKMAAALGAMRVIAFGSTGRFTKEASASLIEQDFVSQQVAAERRFKDVSEDSGIAWTLFRPTMIYGTDADLNVTFIKSFIRRFGFFPLPFGAKGLRQPVHADDLAAACVAALGCENSFNRAYNLGGGERLAYADMVRRIFSSEGKRARVVAVPAQLLYLFVGIVSRFPKYNFVRREMVDRMFEDLIADNTPAKKDFEYCPRMFQC